MTVSSKWKEWRALIDLKTCLICRGNHGKIYALGEDVNPVPPIHPNCRCIIERMEALVAGTATRDGTEGADWYLKHTGKLPEYYIDYELAKKLGWKPIQGNLAKVLPGRMISRGIYDNDDEKLPWKFGRVWYEADINYTSGYRNTQRIVYSNDGLIFVTYDHYKTFKEIQ